MHTADGVRVRTIRQVASKYDVSLRALRFYEQRGLLSPMHVGQSRFYTAEDETRLQIIIVGKRIGFSLTEIQKLMLSRSGAVLAGAQAINLLDSEQIQTQIAQLEVERAQIEAALEELYATRKKL